MVTKIIDIYNKSGFITKLHIWVRYKTCPFLTIEQFIPKQGLIIDYGCGYGIFSHILSTFSPARKVYGFDISERKIREAKKTAGMNSKIMFSGNKNELYDMVKTSDCIAIIDVMCYLSNRDREDMLKAFYKNLKQGAILIIKDIQKAPSIKYAWLYFQELIIVKLLNITQARFLNFFSVNYFSKLLNDIGFEVHITDISKNYLYPHILFVCKKAN